MNELAGHAVRWQGTDAGEFTWLQKDEKPTNLLKLAGIVDYVGPSNTAQTLLLCAGSI